MKFFYTHTYTYAPSHPSRLLLRLLLLLLLLLLDTDHGLQLGRQRVLVVVVPQQLHRLVVDLLRRTLHGQVARHRVLRPSCRNTTPSSTTRAAHPTGAGRMPVVVMVVVVMVMPGPSSATHAPRRRRRGSSSSSGRGGRGGLLALAGVAGRGPVIEVLLRPLPCRLLLGALPRLLLQVALVDLVLFCVCSCWCVLVNCA